MKTRGTLAVDKTDSGFPNEAELAALRGWYAGPDTRAAVAPYLGDRRAAGARRCSTARARRPDAG